MIENVVPFFADKSKNYENTHRESILEILMNVTIPFRRKLTPRFGAN